MSYRHRVGVLIATALVVSSLAGCSGPVSREADERAAPNEATPTPSPTPKGPNNKALIRKAWNRYAHAVVFRDAGDAIEHVSNGTLLYFDKVRFAASNSGSQQIMKMPVADRLLIGALRLRFKPDRLLKMDSKDILRFCLEEGMSGVSLKTSKLKLTTIKVDDEDGLALARFKIKGEKRPKLRLDFLRESGDWKIDFMPLIRFASSFMIVLSRDEGIPIDQLILRILEVQSGRTVDATIWNLPKD